MGQARYSLGVEALRMASNIASPDWGRILLRGVVAGLVGAIVLAVFLWAWFAPQGATLASIFRLDAHDVRSDDPLIGALAYLGVSLAWGIGYAYAAATRPNIANQPLLSGFVYGFIVWLLMQFVLMLGELWVPITLPTLGTQLLAHTIFFGIPVALTTRALTRT